MVEILLVHHSHQKLMIQACMVGQFDVCNPVNIKVFRKFLTIKALMCRLPGMLPLLMHCTDVKLWQELGISLVCKGVQ